MHRRKFVRFIGGTAATVLLLAVSGCADHTHTRTQIVHTPVPPPPAYYEYYYYPDVMVYYHIYTGYYYYFFNGAWRQTKQRPGYLYFDDRRRHTIVIRDEQPYSRHAEHRRRFPSQPVPPGNAYGHDKGSVPPGNRGIGYGPTQTPSPQSQGVGRGPVQPGVQPQLPPQSQGAGRGPAQPGVQPQLPPQSQGVGHGHGRGGHQGAGGAPFEPQQSGAPQIQPVVQPQPQPVVQPQPQPVMQPQPQPVVQPSVQPRPQSQPPGNAYGTAKPASTCDSGWQSGKGKGGGACK